MPYILANTGVPMIFPQVILMTLAFIPVVLIESMIVRQTLGLTTRRAFKDVALANLATTLLGVPLAWGFMLVLELVGTAGGTAYGLDSPARMLAAVTLQSAWLVPYEEHLAWMIPAAATFLLIPCFVVSVIIEHQILVRRWSDRTRKQVFCAVVRVNFWSYLFLFLAGSWWTSSALE